MLPDEELRRLLAQVEVRPWKGHVFRHMFAGIPPDRENVRGARWNAPGIAAIYTSLHRQTALAEADFRLSLESVPLRRDAARTMYRIHVALNAVADLREWHRLARFGITRATLESIEQSCLHSCQRVGAGVSWYEHEGLWVPSARADGTNLVIFPNNRKPGWSFEVAEREELRKG